MRRAFLGFVLCGFLSLSARVLADTPVSGDIVDDTEWTTAGSPYILTGSVRVKTVTRGGAGTTLTIDPGVTVKFNSGAQLVVGIPSFPGNLQVGTPAGAPVIFTSNLASPTKGSWNYIYINTPDMDLAFYNVQIQWGANAIYYTSLLQNLTLSNVSIQNSTTGLYAGGRQLTVTGSTFSNNTTGFSTYGGAQTISGSAFNNNSTGLSLGSVATVSGSTINGNTQRGLVLTGNGSASTFTSVEIGNNTSFPITQDAMVTLPSLAGMNIHDNGIPMIEVSGNGGVGTATWRNVGMPFVVTQTVLPGGTVSIPAGVTVRVRQTFALQGDFRVDGTTASPVTFQADTASPPLGYWAGLTLSAATSYLNGAVVTDATNGVVATNSGQTIRFSTLQHNTTGLRVNSGAMPTIFQTSFSGNTAGLVNATTTNLVQATLCDWSAADGPSGSGPGTGQSITAGVAFEPWLTTPRSTTQYISSFSFSDRKFNPAIATAKWTVGTLLAGNWTLTIRDSGSVLQRTITGTGLSTTLQWDGKNDSAVNVPDGLYTYQIENTGSSGGTASPVKGKVYLDRTFRVEITAPVSGATFSNLYTGGSTALAIVGSASMANISSWKLDYGAGASPTTWTTLGSGTTSVNGVTLGTLQTALPFANGLYTFRLQASDTLGNSVTRLVSQTVSNFSATRNAEEFNPSAGQTLFYSSTVPISVTETLEIRPETIETPIRTLFSGARAGQTTAYVDTWDGKDQSAVLVTDGIYRYVATFTDGTNTLVWNLTGQGDPPANYDYRYPTFSAFDPFNNQPLTFTYQFTRPGRTTVVFLPAGTYTQNCNPPNYCLKSFAWESDQLQTVQWAGVDSTGTFRQDLTRIAVSSDRFNFWKNAVVVYGTNPRVSNVTVTPALFGPSFGTQTIAFDLTSYQSLSFPAVSITIFNQASLSVLRTLSLTNVAAGHQTTAWDGKADNGAKLAPGNYLITVKATDQRGVQAAGQTLTTIVY